MEYSVWYYGNEKKEVSDFQESKTIEHLFTAEPYTVLELHLFFLPQFFRAEIQRHRTTQVRSSKQRQSDKK